MNDLEDETTKTNTELECSDGVSEDGVLWVVVGITRSPFDVEADD